MYRVTDEQVDFILRDIERKGIAIEDLQLNLLDHICCMLEERMQPGSDFETCYNQIIRQFYKNELREIEEETIQLLTYKNYYGMKKLMFISGAYAAFAFVSGSFFKIMRWPSAGPQLISAILVFSLVFLPLVFLLKTKETNGTRNKLVLGIATLVGMLYCLSCIFAVQHWPGSRTIWLSTLCISFFVLLPVYFISGIRKPETRLNTIVTTIILVGVLGVEFTMTAIHKKPKQETVAKVEVKK